MCDIKIGNQLIHAILVAPSLRKCTHTCLLCRKVSTLSPRLLLRLQVLFDLTFALDLSSLPATFLSLLISRLLDSLDGLSDQFGLLILTNLVVDVAVALTRRHLPFVGFHLSYGSHLVETLLHGDLPVQ